MNIRKIVFLGMWALIAGIMGWLWPAIMASGTGQIFRIDISDDGTMWTVSQELPEGEREDGTPVFWYAGGTEYVTGKVSEMREPGEGEHAYWYNRTGEIPVGKWKVEDTYAYCTFRGKGEGKDVIVSGSPDSCGQPYFSGWKAYCADCGEPILRGNIHMSRAAAESIDQIDVDKGYYFLCPCRRIRDEQNESGGQETGEYTICGHLDKYWEAAPHRCKGISYNRYRIVYDANGARAEDTMAPSFHLYNNGDYYEGSPAAAAGALALCTYNRTEEGYIFVGWNTRPDGTGISYDDGAEIKNLTSENYEEGTNRGTVVLYAQWERAESVLKIDANGGNYQGENPVIQCWGASWTWDEGKLTPPTGYTAFFHTDGGSMEVSRITGTSSFQGWELLKPANGELFSGGYRFTGEDRTVDTVRAVYASDPILLPEPQKEGYFFCGWYYDKGCGKLAGYGGEACLLKENVTLYAKWADLKLTAVAADADNSQAGRINLSWEHMDNAGKVYRLYQRAEDNEEFKQIFSGEEEGREFLNQPYPYEGTSRMLTIPSSGFYFLEAAGAQGENYGSCTGGFGGKTTGMFYLEKGESIEITVGGQNGYNGGGAAEKFGKGGGCTIVTSDRKGILMIAGGGGGATVSQNGKSGGSETGYGVGEYHSGEAGMAGGGGGHTKGTAGARIEHIHSEENGCYTDGSLDALTWEHAIQPVVREWKDESEEDYHIKDNRYFSSQIGNVRQLIPVNGNTVLDLGVWMQGIGINLLSKESYIKVMDQNGVPFFTVTLEEIRREWDNFENRVVLPLGEGIYHGWPPIANVTMLTDWRQSNPDGGEYDYLLGYYIKYPIFYQNNTTRFAAAELDENFRNPIFNGDYAEEYYPPYSLWKSDILSHRGFGDRPLLFSERSTWYGMSGVHFKYEIPIPQGTTGLYLYGEGMMDALDINEVSHPVGSCEINFDKIILTGGKLLSCNTEDADIPASGGGNYINAKYALSFFTQAGSNSGNGDFLIRADKTGLLEAGSMNYMEAPDKAAPCAVEEGTVTMTVAGDSCLMVHFDEAEDCGTRYFFRAEAYSILTGEKVCDSNIAECVVKSGVKGYYYLTDTKSGTELANFQVKDRLVFTENRNIRVNIGETAQYLHIAAVDNAGNIGETVHIRLDKEKIKAAWKVSAGRVEINSAEGGQGYGNIAGSSNIIGNGNIYTSGEGTYYVRADGSSPFFLSFRSHMHGPARMDYQINHQIFAFRTEVWRQIQGTVLPYSETTLSEEPLAPEKFRQWAEGFSLVTDAVYTKAVRYNQAEDVEYSRAFVMSPAMHGVMVTVMPIAGAVSKEMAEYSDREESSCAIRLIGDGTGPEIKGLEKLAEWRLIDRNVESVALEVFAEDTLSGVGEFYLEVRNRDNFHEERYLPDDDGVIRVSITEAEPVFSGDFAVFAYAADRVGNETTVSREFTEFELAAEALRILPPHDPVLKQGESAILYIEVWGYAEKAEVVFPEFLEKYNKTFLYTASPQYRKEEKIQFMIPLNAPEEEYEITVRAYKGDKQLEAHPVIRTVEVNGSVLDEIRTRLR